MDTAWPSVGWTPTGGTDHARTLALRAGPRQDGSPKGRATIADVAFTRWDPLRDLLALQEHLGQIVGSDAPGWTPPVDLFEHEHSFVLIAEIPGLSRNDVEIHAEEGRIVLRGERPCGQVPCEQYHRVERGHGRFSRTFLLPEPIEVDGVSADLKDGLLTITVPKVAGRSARRIDVT
jgi:HSP20 family protein